MSANVCHTIMSENENRQLEFPEKEVPGNSRPPEAGVSEEPTFFVHATTRQDV